MPGTIKGKAWKFAQAFYGPCRVLTITPINAEVPLVDKPEKRSIFVALDRLRTCPGEMKDVSWSGYEQKRKPTQSKATLNLNLLLLHNNLLTQVLSHVCVRVPRCLKNSKLSTFCVSLPSDIL